jgi:hypothetical protein
MTHRLTPQHGRMALPLCAALLALPFAAQATPPLDPTTTAQLAAVPIESIYNKASGLGIMRAVDLTEPATGPTVRITGMAMQVGKKHGPTSSLGIDANDPHLQTGPTMMLGATVLHEPTAKATLLRAAADGTLAPPPHGIANGVKMLVNKEGSGAIRLAVDVVGLPTGATGASADGALNA